MNDVEGCNTMPRGSLIERLTATEEGMKLYQQERAIQEVTELICALMDERGINRTELAKRLGRSKGYITQLLDGQANMTLRTISDVFTAIGLSIHFQDGPMDTRTARVSLFTAEWDPSEGVSYDYHRAVARPMGSSGRWAV